MPSKFIIGPPTNVMFISFVHNNKVRPNILHVVSLLVWWEINSILHMYSSTVVLEHWPKDLRDAVSACGQFDLQEWVCMVLCDHAPLAACCQCESLTTAAMKQHSLIRNLDIVTHNASEDLQWHKPLNSWGERATLMKSQLVWPSEKLIILVWFQREVGGQGQKNGFWRKAVSKKHH